MTPAKIEKKTRWDFAQYLKYRCNVVGRDSHWVAHSPGHLWYFVRFGDGLVRAFPNAKTRNWWVRTKGQFVGGARESWAMRWIKEPAK